MGGSILRNPGARATYYVAMGSMGTTNEFGEQFHPEDLYSLMSDGRELASHTFSHASSRALPLSAFRADVQKGQEAIRHLLGLSPSANFAYP